MWSRPDITSVEVRAFGYVPGKWVDVTTFEIKPADSIAVSAIYEARAHRTSATHAYVVLHVPDGTVPDSPLDDMLAVAREQQIGVITVVDPADYDTWNKLEVALRVVPDPALLENFIATQLLPALRDKLSRSIADVVDQSTSLRDARPYQRRGGVPSPAWYRRQGMSCSQPLRGPTPPPGQYRSFGATLRRQGRQE